MGLPGAINDTVVSSLNSRGEISRSSHGEAGKGLRRSVPRRYNGEGWGIPGKLSGTSIYPTEREPMDLPKILDELRQERQWVEEAIVALERVAGVAQRRRGRPPKWVADVNAHGGGHQATKSPQKTTSD